MKKIMRYITLLIIIALLSTHYDAFAADETPAIVFSDLDETHWAYEGIYKLVYEGIIVGYPDGTFKPEGNITRAELVKIVNMVFGFTDKQETTSFSDVKPEDWFHDNVLIAQQAGYIVGYPDGTFKPNGLITREEFCKILDAINNFIELPLSTPPADEVSPWAVEYVNRVLANRIMFLDESNNFRAVEKATRAEVCETLAKFIIEDAEEKFPSTGGSSGRSSDKDELTQKELYEIMDRVIFELSTDVINNLETEEQKEIINDIINNMIAYKENNNHDYRKAAEQAYEKYKKLSENERETLKYEVQIRNATKDLLILQEFFFPDVEI